MIYHEPHEEIITDALERDRLPPDIDVVSREYFTDVVTDDRIKRLFNAINTKTEFVKFEATTPQPVLAPLFNHNALDDDKAVTRFEYVGSHQIMISDESLEDPSAKKLRFSLRATEGDFNKISFAQNHENAFDVWSTEKDVLFSMSALDVAKLAFRAANESRVARKGLSMITGGNPNSEEYNSIIRKLWRHTSTNNAGVVEFDHLVSLKTFDTELGTPVEIRLGYKELEPGETTKVQLTLERALLYPELGSESVQRLEVNYSDVPSQDASQIIRGLDDDISSIRSVRTDVSGRRTQLDTKDPEIMTVFVDAFEELLDSAA